MRRQRKKQEQNSNQENMIRKKVNKRHSRINQVKSEYQN